jgi:cytochrome oxidase Cu insertion factor (SCO1/SenC/PrrC family)
MNFHSFKGLHSAFYWLMFSLSLSLAGCQVTTPAVMPRAAAAPAAENKAPAFTLPSSDGNSISLSDYVGQPVLYFHMANG